MATEVYFTTNPSEFTKLEGLYVSERNPPGFIRGADLSVVGIAGACVRGPTSVQNITSTARFLEVYGGRERVTGAGGVLVGEIWAMLINKPFGAIAVRRVAAADAVAASLTVEDLLDGTGTPLMQIDASSVGAWGQDVKVRVEDASDGVSTSFNLLVSYAGEEVLFENLTINGATDDNLAEVVGSDLATTIKLTKLADGRPVNFSTITEADWIANKETDEFMFLGKTLTSYTSVTGVDGAVLIADETVAITDLSNFAGISIVTLAGTSVDQSTLNGQMVTEAALVSDRMFITWAGVSGQAVAVETAQLTTDITTRQDRIVWCYNSPYTLDPELATEIQRGPHEWMCSILSQNDVDIHPGSQQTAVQNAGIRRLASEVLTRADLIALRNAGISTLEKLPGAFLFKSGVTTSLASGRTEITRRRSTDFLQLSASSRLKYYVKGKNTAELRVQMAGELIAFGQSLRADGRIVENHEVDQASVNTEAQRAQGVEKLLWRVKLIGHMLHVVLETEIATGTVIEA